MWLFVLLISVELLTITFFHNYHIYIAGQDVHVVDIDLPGTMTSYNISRVPLTPGILFYSNVVGYNLSGIHSTETSDGIMVDSVPPTSGTVFDGIGIL